MNKIKYIIFFILISLLNSCNKDEISSQQADSFIKLYGSWGTDIGNDVKEFDNGYLVLATVASAGNADSTEIALIKTNKFGNIESLDSITSGGHGKNTASKLLLTDDGGFIILGTYHVSDDNTDMYVGKFNSGLDLEWEKIIGSTSNETGNSIKKATTGYIIVGSTTKVNLVNGNSEGSWDIVLTKIDDTGNVEWENSFGGSEDDIANDIVVNNNNYLIVGTSNSFHEPGQAGNNIIAIETNLQGNETDKITYGSSNNDYGSSVIDTDDGYLIVGTIEDVSGGSEVYVIKVANNIHNIVWNKLYGDNTSEGFDIVKSGAGYIAVGSQEQTTGKAAYFLNIDGEGNEISGNAYGGYNSQVIYSIERTSDDGFIMVGSSGYDGNDMICLIKVNSEGEL